MDLALLGLGVLVSQEIINNQNKKKKVNRKFGVHPLNRSRDQLGHYNKLLPELLDSDTKFFNYTRMTKIQFKSLLEMVSPRLKRKRPTRKSLSPEFLLFSTLRHLATGNTQSDLAFTFKIGQSTAFVNFKRVCDVLWEVLSPIYMSSPTTTEWKCIAKDFWEKWQLPNCCGALDGKHCNMVAPANSGSEFFNYKKTFSIVLMALVDANYNFIFVSAGSPGSFSDGGILQDTDFGKDILTNTMNTPNGIPLPGENTNFPFYFVGDAAFPLKKNIMKPFPGSNLEDDELNFNYRISRARRVVENAFGILAAKFRIYHKMMYGSEHTVTSIILATTALHNFIRKTNITNQGLQSEDYLPTTIQNCSNFSNERNPSQEAKQQRNILKQFLYENQI